jgi:N-acyl-D-amino-acid deacylase
VEVGEAAVAGHRQIDAEGLFLAPGFIDMHSHSDHCLFVNPTAESKVTQGITTEVCGNCGDASAPLLDPREREQIVQFLSDNGSDAEWTSVAEYFTALETSGIAPNFITLVGHGSLRAGVVGCEDRPATAAEMQKMRDLVQESMAAGAAGLSSGLIYAPGCYGGTSEVTELCKPVGEAGGLYSTHMRSEGDHLLEAVEESIQIAQESGARLQISHHKACGPANWGKVRGSLALIESARARGQDVAADQYPYVATATNLSVNVPQWAHDGGGERLMERLADPALTGRLRNETSANVEGGYSDPAQGWKDVVIASVETEANKWAEGLSMFDVARRWNMPFVDALFRFLLEERCRAGMIHFTISEDDVETVMRAPFVMAGTDATARALSGPLAVGKPHPRTFGTMARILGRYVRERGLISLEEAVRKMTSLPASRLRLADRGRLAEGFKADMVLFDAATVGDAATFADPFQHARGIPYVFVNGSAVVEDGRVSGCLPGRCLRFNAA